MLTHSTTLGTIPACRLAAPDDAAAAAARAALRERLRSGKTVNLKQNGSVTDDKGKEASISVPPGKLATPDDAAAAAARAALRERLRSGKTVNLKQNGSVTDDKGKEASISVPPGKLAALRQWYEKNPALLEAEKAAMAKNFPDFTLGRLDDGRLYWLGELHPGIYETKYGRPLKYTVMAIYDENHPNQVMGSSVRVYPVAPDVDELIEIAGFRPFHLLRDSADQCYLCTAEAENVRTGRTITTAASVLAWAVKWFLCYELVLTGDMPREEFNRHGGV